MKKVGTIIGGVIVVIISSPITLTSAFAGAVVKTIQWSFKMGYDAVKFGKTKTDDMNE